MLFRSRAQQGALIVVHGGGKAIVMNANAPAGLFLTARIGWDNVHALLHCPDEVVKARSLKKGSAARRSRGKKALRQHALRPEEVLRLDESGGTWDTSGMPSVGPWDYRNTSYGNGATPPPDGVCLQVVPKDGSPLTIIDVEDIAGPIFDPDGTGNFYEIFQIGRASCRERV